MATQNASSPASRDSSKAAGLKSTKVEVPTSTKPKLDLGVRQPKVGKETANGGKAMGKEAKADKGLGQMVKTVKSNPIAGSANVQGNTAMGNGAIKNGFV